MADNDANRANFEELKGHIDLASKRIRALQPGTDNYTQTVEDLEDYYERTVQLRKIQADTALAERDEVRQMACKTTFRLRFTIVVLFAVIFCEFVLLAPRAAGDVWMSIEPYATVDRIGLLTVLAAVIIARHN
tara:strand:+ start:1587 stop:1985 length:399 start_codon:yes stop_codon:yes gene_type:complete